MASVQALSQIWEPPRTSNDIKERPLHLKFTSASYPHRKSIELHLIIKTIMSRAPILETWRQEISK
eukprot:2619026-Amphidinium_carterae.1